MLVWRAGINPGDLVEPFRSDVIQLLTDLPDMWQITQGFRSWKYQNGLWIKYQAGGPKAAPPGKSPHEYGLAVDVVLDADPLTPKIEPNYNTADERWMRLFDTVLKHPRLHSGRSFDDADHIEAVNWKAHIIR